MNEILDQSSFECIETEWNQHDRILRIYVDSEEGVDLQSCSEVNKIIEEDGRLDQLIPDESTLEISSPGIERPLRRIKDFQLYVGSPISVRLNNQYQGKKNLAGRIVVADEKGNVTLDTEEGEHGFSVDNVLKAQMIFEWKS